MKVKVGVSNRHIHLSESDFNYLFPNSDFFSVRDLSQTGEFSSNITANIETDKDIIKNVRIVGPFREKSQVEISISDAYFLGVDPKIKMSGELNDTPSIKVIGLNGNFVFVPVIIASRHIHVNTKDLDKYRLYKGKKVKVKIDGIRGGILDNVIIRAKDNYTFELHIDTDEANAMNLKNGEYVEILEEE